MYLELENELIQKAMGGDMMCFEKIVELYEKLVYNICYRYFRNEEDAKDTAQEVFIKIFKNLNKYNFSCKFSTWTYKIAVNSCIDLLRKNKAKYTEQNIDDFSYELKDSEKSPLESVIVKENISHIEEAINNMPDEYKTYIILRDINGLSYNEISEITDTPLGTVKSRISRARQCLKYSLVNDYYMDERR